MIIYVVWICQVACCHFFKILVQHSETKIGKFAVVVKQLLPFVQLCCIEGFPLSYNKESESITLEAKLKQ